MKLIQPSCEILTDMSQDFLGLIERAGRICYKSEDRITKDSAKKFVSMLIASGHESVLEHPSITVKFTTSRAIANQLVRHRIASFSQEPTRYVNYCSEKHGKELTFIYPEWINQLIGIFGLCDFADGVIKDLFKHPSYGKYKAWKDCLQTIENTYTDLILLGAKPEDARSVLPSDLKTEIIMTCNLRQWRHVLKLRTSKKAHPDMRRLMIGLLCQLQEKIPVVFDDINKE